MLKRLVLCSIITLTLSSCSLLQDMATDALLGSDKGLDVDANVGQAKTEGEENVAQQANTAVSVKGGNREEVFEGEVGTVINESPLGTFELILLVLLAGWAIPSPSEMLKGLVSSFAFLREARRDPQ